MDDKLTTFSSKDDIEISQGKFLVPIDWNSCGVVIHVSGGAGIDAGQPIALAITNDLIALCDHDGPEVSIPIMSIKEVKAVDLSGISFPVKTPSGLVEMVPPRAKGVSISYVLNPMGTQVELTIYTLTPKSAFEWVNVILEAIQKKSKKIGEAAKITRR